MVKLLKQGGKLEPNPHNAFRKKENEKRRKLRKIIILVSCIFLVVLIICYFIKGKTTVTGESPSPERTTSLICKKAGEKYPKINDTDSNNKTVSIVAIFSGENELKSIALEYTLKYSSKEEVERAEALAHFDFGSHLGNYGFANNEFSNKFSMYDDELIVSLYDNQKAIESADRAGYFMLDEEFNRGEKLHMLDGMREAFEKKGFACKASSDK